MKIKKLLLEGHLFRYLIYKCIVCYRTIGEAVKFLILPKDRVILLWGHGESLNVGDAINLPIIEFLSGKRVVLAKYIRHSWLRSRVVYSAIGSIIQWSGDGCHIWGSGLISPNAKVPRGCKVFAVRGPLTKQVMEDAGYAVPNIFGDPGVILPIIYNPVRNGAFGKAVGLLPHYSDKYSAVVRRFRRSGFLFIDIEVGSRYAKVIDKIVNCDAIVTSSLHGLIFCHAYKVPVLWADFGGEITGDGFKFRDYLLGVGIDLSPIKLTGYESIDDLMEIIDLQEVSHDIQGLLDNCPFIDPNRKAMLSARLSTVINRDRNLALGG